MQFNFTWTSTGCKRFLFPKPKYMSRMFPIFHLSISFHLYIPNLCRLTDSFQSLQYALTHLVSKYRLNAIREHLKSYKAQLMLVTLLIITYFYYIRQTFILRPRIMNGNSGARMSTVQVWKLLLLQVSKTMHCIWLKYELEERCFRMKVLRVVVWNFKLSKRKQMFSTTKCW